MRTYKRQLGLSGDADTTEEHEKQVLNWFRDAVENAYRDDVEGSLRKVGHDVCQLALTAKLDKSSLSRLRSKKVQPSWRTYCLGLAYTDLAMSFDQGIVYVRKATVATTQLVSTELLEHRTDSDFTTTKMEVLEFVRDNPTWFKLARDQSGRDTLSKLLQEFLLARTGKTHRIDVQTIKAVIADWEYPYRYFHGCIGMSLDDWWF